MNVIQYILLTHYLPATSVPDVLQTLADFHNSYAMEDIAQVGIEYTCGQALCILCMYKGVQMKCKLPTYWNLLSCSMTAPKPVFSFSSILPPPVSLYTL
jgi:hypothetical protein